MRTNECVRLDCRPPPPAPATLTVLRPSPPVSLFEGSGRSPGAGLLCLQMLGQLIRDFVRGVGLLRKQRQWTVLFGKCNHRLVWLLRAKRLEPS